MVTEILLAVLILLNVVLLVTVLLKDRGRYLIDNIEKNQTRTEGKIHDEFARSRHETNQSFKELREELQHSVTNFADSILKRMTEISTLQNTQFENIRKTVEAKLRLLQEDNNKRLEEMRLTVDEKLHSTLEKRLGEAFKQVGDRLEKVHQGLGEMQKLATGVGDLKNVLTNIKARGTLGEIQLENQLTQLLSPQQYDKNVKTKEGSNAFVEFAIKLPGKERHNEWVWLPIDSKFPLEQYELLLNAYKTGDKQVIDRVSRKLASDIKNFAKEIRDKYIDPPGTTDFALMYLPIEGLYAEALRFSGLFEGLQRECRVVPVGPTTLAAILNSLQMGFRTLAIEKRSSEVWKLLGVVKTQFGKFGDLLDKTRQKLDEAGKSIDDASRKSRYIEGRLTRVQELPAEDSQHLLEDN
jgi:DNA recombination protein RmuC